jgi:hypothetical protein
MLYVVSRMSCELKIGDLVSFGLKLVRQVLGKPIDAKGPSFRTFPDQRAGKDQDGAICGTQRKVAKTTSKGGRCRWHCPRQGNHVVKLGMIAPGAEDQPVCGAGGPNSPFW